MSIDIDGRPWVKKRVQLGRIIGFQDFKNKFLIVFQYGKKKLGRLNDTLKIKYDLVSYLSKFKILKPDGSI